MKAVLDCEICGNEFRVDLVNDRRRGQVPEDRQVRMYGPDGADDLWDDLEWEHVCPECERAIVVVVKELVKKRKPIKTAKVSR